ncbi:hypothetical protein EV122DRAFT_206243 [Schizophyllum commune]|nr:hypothetical protein K525DRAFT_213793 [Schizophyllum commune Loenen D]KAI5822331.1 hypothetical protein K523DRAFT_318419 [Schizophyllum commune Tattone D]
MHITVHTFTYIHRLCLSFAHPVTQCLYTYSTPVEDCVLISVFRPVATSSTTALLILLLYKSVYRSRNSCATQSPNTMK